MINIQQRIELCMCREIPMSQRKNTFSVRDPYIPPYSFHLESHLGICNKSHHVNEAVREVVIGVYEDMDHPIFHYP